MYACPNARYQLWAEESAGELVEGEAPARRRMMKEGGGGREEGRGGDIGFEKGEREGRRCVRLSFCLLAWCG